MCGVKEHLRAKWRRKERWSRANTPPALLLLHVHQQDAPTHLCSGRCFLHQGCPGAVCVCGHVCAWQGAPWCLSQLVSVPPFLLMHTCLCCSELPLPGGPSGSAHLPYCVPPRSPPPESLTSSSDHPNLSSGLPTPDDSLALWFIRASVRACSLVDSGKEKGIHGGEWVIFLVVPSPQRPFWLSTSPVLPALEQRSSPQGPRAHCLPSSWICPNLELTGGVRNGKSPE